MPFCFLRAAFYHLAPVKKDTQGPMIAAFFGNHEIRRDLQGPAGTWTRVTLAMTHGNGDPRCVFLEKGTPERRDGGILWENGARK